MSHPVPWAQVQRRFTLMAQGLAGRALDLGPLPAEMAQFTTAHDNLAAWRVLVLRRLGRIEAAATLPGADGRAWPRLLSGLFGWLETLRIDAALIRRYPGAAADLARVRAATLARLGAGAAPAGPVLAALLRLRRHAIGAPLAGPRPTAGDAWQAWVDRLCAEPAGPRDSLVVALRICHALGAGARPGRAAGRAPWPQPPAADAADPGAAVPPPDAAAGEGEGEGADPGAPDLTLLGAESQPGAGAGGALATQEVPAAAGPADAADADGAQDPPAAGAARVDARPARQRFVYDEWNHLTQRYLAGWCQVHEQRLQGDEVGFGREVRRRHATLARQVRRQFGAIRPEAWQRVHRTRDGDDFELDALVDAVVERRAGRIGDERLYLWRERAAREVAAAFLVDMSASTDFPVPDPDAAPAPAAEPEPEADDEHPMLYGGWFGAAAALPPAPKRRVIDVAKESLALMCDALHLLGDRHAVYGFSGRGRENVEFWVAKEFREPLSARTWAALAAMQPRGATRMGAAVRHALAKLAREPARLKLLIIVSDGYPQDSDYGPKPAGRGLGADDAEYGIQDTAQALREAERAGVSSFHVTIDPAGHDYLRRMCAEHRYLVIDDVRALPAALGKVYRALAV